MAATDELTSGGIGAMPRPSVRQEDDEDVVQGLLRAVREGRVPEEVLAEAADKSRPRRPAPSPSPRG